MVVAPENTTPSLRPEATTPEGLPDNDAFRRRLFYIGDDVPVKAEARPPPPPARDLLPPLEDAADNPLVLKNAPESPVILVDSPAALNPVILEDGAKTLASVRELSRELLPPFEDTFAGPGSLVVTPALSGPPAKQFAKLSNFADDGLQQGSVQLNPVHEKGLQELRAEHGIRFILRRTQASTRP